MFEGTPESDFSCRRLWAGYEGLTKIGNDQFSIELPAGFSWNECLGYRLLPEVGFPPNGTRNGQIHCLMVV